MSIKRLLVTAVAESPVRVGGSRDPVRGVDLPVATVGGVPVIPGSSLKGALRARIEKRLLNLAETNPLLCPCIPSSSPSQSERSLQGYRTGGSCAAQSEEEASAEAKPAAETICPACYLLGAQGLVGFVRVPFLVSSISQEELVGIAIDRGRGAVRARGNWTYEFVPTSATFTGELEIVLVDESRGWRLGSPRPGFEEQDRWLAKGDWTADRIEKELVIEPLKAIDVLGGFKSKGFGKVKITVTPCE
jgi:CRISPR/Cas system CSM-associated protein Csm3 (group 7 of RAMP superfamily)